MTNKTTAAPALKQILVVVHPGSACGSADFNLGTFDARAARQGLRHEWDSWQGGVIVIDGAMSVELEGLPMFNDSLRNLVARAERSGQVARRVMGCDNSESDQVWAIGKVLGELKEQLLGTEFVVTGALYMADGSGCVGSVHDELIRLGFTSTVSPFAVSMDD